MKTTSKTGSVLMVTLILGLALAITATSVCSLILSSLRQTNRTFHYNTATDLAEAGVEEALWALNNQDWTHRNWITVDASTKIYRGSFAASELKAPNSVKGYFNVVIQNITTVPFIVAEAVVQPSSGSVIRKQIRINTKNTNLFLPPFTAITKMVLNGGEVNSYRMAEGNPMVAPVRYETTVASPTLIVSEMSIGTPADIYGYVNVGFDEETNSSFAPGIKGSVVGPNTLATNPGVLQTSGGNLVDTNRIAYDFTQEFPAPPEPEGFFDAVVPSANSDGVIILGDPTGATTLKYQLVNYSETRKNVVVVGPIELKILGDFSVGGRATFTIATGNITVAGTQYNVNASAKIFAYSSLTIGGNGVFTGGSAANVSVDPRQLVIYGMNTSSQTISIGGNGNMAASVYAPKANATFNGGGSGGYFAGAIVANNITVNGQNYKIRFPEEMMDQPAGTTYQVSRWIELRNRTNWYSF